MEDFNWASGENITKAIAGKTVVKVENLDEGQDSILQFDFSDDFVLRFRYDWIYEWEIRPTSGCNRPAFGG